MWLQLSSDWLNVSFYIRRNVNILGLKVLIRPCLCLSSLTLLDGRQKNYLTCKKLGVGTSMMMIWLELYVPYSSSCHHHLHHSCFDKNPERWHSGSSLPGLSWKTAVKWMMLLFISNSKQGFIQYQRVPFQLRKWDSQHFPDQVYSLCRNWQTCFKYLVAPAVSTTSSRLFLIYTKSFPSPCTCELWLINAL